MQSTREDLVLAPCIAAEAMAVLKLKVKQVIHQDLKTAKAKERHEASYTKSSGGYA